MLGAALALLGTSACSSRQARNVYEDITGQRSGPEHQLDLNTASRAQLAKLPGLTDKDAENIIAHRPYSGKQGLLNKKVLSQNKYDQIRDYVYASK
jgi:DNA uptake protein ComE-like DNA-binding protein